MRAAFRRAWKPPGHGTRCTFAPDGFFVWAGENVRYVSIADCCADHDADYERGGTDQERLESDARLSWCVRCRLLAAGSRAAGFISTAYHGVVRAAGWAFWRK